MLNNPIFIKKLALMFVGVALMMVLVTSAKAEERVTREHQFDLKNFNDVEISNSIGRIEIVPVDGQKLRVTLDIEAKEKGFFRRSVDVSDMDLTIRERGDTLFLAFEESDVSAHWYVEMPTVRYTAVQMGVGELELEIGATELNVEMGVGDVNIVAPRESVGRINLNVGVGDARVRGAEILDRKSAFISKNIRAEGKGNHDIDVNLGVGDINLRLNK